MQQKGKEKKYSNNPIRKILNFVERFLWRNAIG